MGTGYAKAQRWQSETLIGLLQQMRLLAGSQGPVREGFGLGAGF